MLRVVCATVFATALAPAAAGQPVIQPGEYKGQTGQDKKYITKFLPDGVRFAKGANNLPQTYGFASLLGLKVKAGEGVSVAVRAPGPGRTVALLLVDPTNTVIATTRLEDGAATLAVEEVAAEGTYTLMVFSGVSGVFTLRTVVKGEGGGDAIDIDAEIKKTEAEIKKLAEKLAQLQVQKAQQDAKKK